MDNSRLGFCPGLRLHLFRIASGGLICKPFYTLIFWQSVQLVQLLPGFYPCKRLFCILRLSNAVCVHFIVQGIRNGLRCTYELYKRIL
nr:MAG TPA: hypothetical protein [Caudoviricetes sp.]